MFLSVKNFLCISESFLHCWLKEEVEIWPLTWRKKYKCVPVCDFVSCTLNNLKITVFSSSSHAWLQNPTINYPHNSFWSDNIFFCLQLAMTFMSTERLFWLLKLPVFPPALCGVTCPTCAQTSLLALWKRAQRAAETLINKYCILTKLSAILSTSKNMLSMNYFKSERKYSNIRIKPQQPDDAVGRSETEVH